MQVKGDKVSGIINGSVVKTFDRPELVVLGKLKSTDSVYGIGGLPIIRTRLCPI